MCDAGTCKGLVLSLSSFETVADWGTWGSGDATTASFTRRTGSTTSFATGPSAAADGQYYVYAETSGGGQSATFELSKTFAAGTELYGISFQYHKYGDTIGNATLESSADGLDWQTLWTKGGNKGAQWLQATAYAGPGHQFLRWRYTAGGYFTGDFALDDIKIGDCLLVGCSAAPNNPCMVPSGSCDQATGLCQVLPDGTTCDDGDSGTVGEVCSAGVCIGTTAAPSKVPIPMPSAAPTVANPSTPTPTVTQVAVTMPAVVVSSSLQMTGVTAADFATPAQQANFASAIESSLTIDATVTNIVATPVTRRRLTLRKLLQSGVVVNYDLEVVVAAGETADTVFAAAVADLTEVVTGSDSPLMTNLAQDLGVTVTVDTTAFVAPTTFVTKTVTVKVPAPAPAPEEGNTMIIIIITVAVTVVVLLVAGIMFFQYAKLKAKRGGEGEGEGALPTAEAMVIGYDEDNAGGTAAEVDGSDRQSIEMQIRANVASRKMRAQQEEDASKSKNKGKDAVAEATVVSTDDKGAEAPEAEGVVMV
jgi:hypothetical protein